MAANQAQIEITAVDKTRAAFENAQRGLNGLTSTAGALNGIMARLAPLVGAASFTSFAKNTIDAADAMYDMGQRTGIAVERLSAWRLVAEQSGTDLNDFSGALAKASKYMVVHGDNLKKLGIDGKTAEQVMIQLADVIAALPADDPRRAALAMEVLGKSAANLLPLLSQGGEAIKKMVDEGQKLPGITTEMARNADALGDNMTKLKLSLEGAAGAMLNPMIPALTDLVVKLQEAATESSTLEAVWKRLKLAAPGIPIIGPTVAAAQAAMGMFGPDKPAPGQIKEGKIKYGAQDKSAAIDALLGGSGKPAKAAKADNWYADLLKQDDIEQYNQMVAEADRRNKLLADSATEAAKALELQAAAWQDIAELQRESDSLALADIEAQGESEQARIDALNKEAEALRAVIDPTIELMNQQDRYFQMLSEGIITQDEYDAGLKALAETTDKTSSMAKDIGLTFTSAFEDAVIGGKKFGDVLKSLGDDIQRLMLRKTITEPLTEGIGKWFENLDFGSFFQANASGGVYGGAGISAYSGQIVSRPTVFPFASGIGLMGEAGAEAILPLSRGADGKLGVKGGGTVVQNNIQIIEGQGTKASVQQSKNASGGMDLKVIIEQVTSMMSRDINRGDGLAPTLENRYGLNAAMGATR